ncbi:MAG: CvpA family protein [Blautia sp.]|nr:CvpA family protein [Blautia sp.]
MDKLNIVNTRLEEVGLTWLGAVCMALILIGIIIGLVRGLVKEVVSIVIVFVSIALVWFLNPYVNHFLREMTPIESKIEDQTRKLLGDQLDSGKIIPADKQQEIIENLDLPENIINTLLKNNNAEEYKELNVNSFIDYIVEYPVNIVMNGISFLITYALVTILLRVLVFVLDIFTRLPVVSGLNKLGGALIGGAKYVIFIWIGMLVITMLCNTEVGRTAMEMIERDRFLSFVYSWNLILKFFVF